MKTTENVQVPEFIRIFEGSNNWIMSRLNAVGLVPASASQVMRSQLKGKLPGDMYFDTGDCVVYHPYSGYIMLVHRSEDVYKLYPRSMSWHDALVLPDEVLESLDGLVLSSKQLDLYTGRHLSKSEAKENLVWQWLAGDGHLLGEYVDYAFDRKRELFGESLGSDDKTMVVDLMSIQEAATFILKHEKKVLLRQWGLGARGSYCIGGDRLKDHTWRMMGVVAPEACSVEEGALAPSATKKINIREYVPSPVQKEFEAFRRKPFPK